MEIDLTKMDISARGLIKIFGGLVVLFIIAIAAWWLVKKITGKASTSSVTPSSW